MEDHSKKILIVEDEILVALSIKKSLEGIGYRVTGIASSHPLAIQLIEKELPDLILMDIKIKGGTDGIGTAQTIRSSFDLPIIYITAHTDEETISRAKHTEPYGYVTKPINIRNLHSTIEMALYKYRAEGIIKENEERYRTLVEGAGQPIFTVTQEGRIFFINRIGLEHFFEGGGVTEDRHISEIFPKAMSRAMLTKIKEAFRSGASQNLETTFEREGTEKWYDVRVHPLKKKTGRVESAMVIALDITTRKNAEKDRIRLVKAVEQADEGIIITDADSRIEYVNPAFESISGYSQSEVIGKTPAILKSSKHDDHFYRELYRSIQEGKTWRGHFINKKKDGSLYEEEATISPVKDEGRITNYVAVKRDVTEKFKLERQLAKAKRLEAIGTLAGGIAHDFNNIIGGIRGQTQLAMIDLHQNNETYENLDQILKACDRAEELVNKILTFSQKEKAKLNPIQVQPIVDEVLSLIEASLPNTIQLSKHENNGSNYILADPTQIHQVLMNLCTNAIHAMSARGGKLIVAIDEVDLDNRFLSSHPKNSPGSYVKLEVKDTGCGMDEDTLDHAFEPFFTTKEPGKGTGMGLAVVHGIVKNHRGIITIESETNIGTTFNLFFPKYVQCDGGDEMPA